MLGGHAAGCWCRATGVRPMWDPCAQSLNCPSTRDVIFAVRAAMHAPGPRAKCRVWAAPTCRRRRRRRRPAACRISGDAPGGCSGPASLKLSPLLASLAGASCPPLLPPAAARPRRPVHRRSTAQPVSLAICCLQPAAPAPPPPAPPLLNHQPPWSAPPCLPAGPCSRRRRAPRCAQQAQRGGGSMERRAGSVPPAGATPGMAVPCWGSGCTARNHTLTPLEPSITTPTWLPPEGRCEPRAAAPACPPAAAPPRAPAGARRGGSARCAGAGPAPTRRAACCPQSRRGRPACPPAPRPPA